MSYGYTGNLMVAAVGEWIVVAARRQIAKLPPDLLVWQLEPLEQEFVWDTLNGMSQVDAYHKTHPHVTRMSALKSGSRWARRDDIIAAKQEIREEVGKEAASMLAAARVDAVSLLISTIKDKDASLTERMRAAQTILDRSGLGGHINLDVTQTQKLEDFLNGTAIDIE